MSHQPLLVVSPHFDDAVLSIGGEIGASPGSIVATVFSGFPRDRDQITSWDSISGFVNAHQAVTGRRLEDGYALAILSAGQLLLDFVDGQYGESITHQRVGRYLVNVFAERPRLLPVGPLGIEHADHLCTADAYLDAVTHLKLENFWLYADLPYYREYPRQAQRRLQRLRKFGLRVAPVKLDSPAVARKRSALACYSSQIRTLHGRDVDAPELVWQVSRSGLDDLPGSLALLRSNVAAPSVFANAISRAGRWRTKASGLVPDRRGRSQPGR